MRIKIMMTLGILILVILNYAIYEKEQIKKYGKIVLLELTPYDPRSLMQGDYMSLYYTINRKASDQALVSEKKQTYEYFKYIKNGGYLVIKTDQNNVAQFVRFHKKEKLSAGEKLLRFQNQYKSIRVMPDSFFFQEGYAQYYINAKYAIFKFDDSGNYLLVGLVKPNKPPSSIEVLPGIN